MNSELKPCPSCGNETHVLHIYTEPEYGFTTDIECSCGLSLSGDSRELAISKWNSLPRKIKLTKEPPNESGFYFWSQRLDDLPVMVSVRISVDGAHSIWHCVDFLGTTATRGGYWAKVDRSMFEVCDE